MNTFDLIILVIWALFILYWIATLWRNKKTRYRKNVAVSGVSARIFTFAILLLLWEVPIFARAIYQPTTSTRILGVILCIIGAGFAVWARRTLGRNWSASSAEVKEQHELIQSGPYRWVRHPIYAGILFTLLGSFVENGKLRVLVFFLIMAVGMILRSRIEEQVMTQQFPDTYPEYKRRTKFIIPGIY